LNSTAHSHDAGADETERRVFEVITSMLGLCVLAPLMAIIAVLIKLESPGPVLFKQTRVGKGEKPFEILKFRSMRMPASDEQTVHTNVENIDTYMFRPVGRKTVIGRTLRACSLDELPNLFNVLRGDLHIVGPRPDEPELVAQYRPEWRQRHNVKPGITGVAQIHGRTDLTYQETMAYDLDYVRNRSFPLDVKIMSKTLAVVLRREGAR
jgi:lipopolysaccharide/colanic/teichoic acid biosynthesis glycosyltransferase